MNTADIVVVGAGIAGASVAARLAPDAKVILVEREDAPGYHSTGRSAAFFAPAYGNEVVRRFTAKSESLYRSPPEEFTDIDFLRKRDVIFLGRADQAVSLEAQHREVGGLARLGVDGIIDRVPVISPDYADAGLLDSGGGDLDVDAILQAFLRAFRQSGGEFVTNAEVLGLERAGDGWLVRTSAAEISAGVVVNASGAWADEIAGLAGLDALGLVPKRRTAFLIDPPGDVDIGHWPLVVDADEEFYFKPDAGRLLVSPADETPSAPMDARPEELDIAIAVDRLTRATSLAVPRIHQPWAGLRTFAADKTFVAGFDPRTQGFFWLAGQGGYGVQTAPGLSAFAADLVLGRTIEPVDADLVTAIDPGRFA